MYISSKRKPFIPLVLCPRVSVWVGAPLETDDPLDGPAPIKRTVITPPWPRPTHPSLTRLPDPDLRPLVTEAPVSVARESTDPEASSTMDKARPSLTSTEVCKQ